MSTLKFKKGDRVRIVSMMYMSCAEQGLFIGNTGTIETVYRNLYGVRTDNAVNSLSHEGEGWAFLDSELEAMHEAQEPARERESAWILLACVVLMALCAVAAGMQP